MSNGTISVARFLALEERVENLERALGRFVPQPNPTVVQPDTTPRPIEQTASTMGHPDWVRPRRRTPDGGYDDAA